MIGDDRADDVVGFIHDTTWDDLPAAVRRQAQRCLLDTVGAAVAGRQTELSHIVHAFAAAAYGGTGAVLWLDGRELSPPGAALANGMTIDAFDIHDGYNLTKGHAGAAVVPAGLATLSLGAGRVGGRELLATLVVGYEVALRAGVALHSTACDYHTSGAWNALGCAAITVRRLGLGGDATRHALGTAEYHGPRSPMMRCVDFPTMVKDGSGWGAMAGVGAALLAGHGFTGAPAFTVEGTETAPFWDDLGDRWRILEQYFKPYAVCRWAQPAVVAALALRNAHHFAPEEIRRISIATFHEAVRLDVRRPQTTEEAQYSLPFPVAAALVHGRLGPAELSREGLCDSRVLALVGRIELVESPTFNHHFPAERFADVAVETTAGDVFKSGPRQPTWEHTAPPSDAELRQKFCWLAATSLPATRVAALERVLSHCAELADAAEIVALLAPPQHAIAGEIEV